MKVALNLLLICLSYIAFGQNKTYLGVEIGPKFELYDLMDNENSITTNTTVNSPIYGITVGQEINKTFTGEVGFYVNHYGLSYSIGENFRFSKPDGMVAFQIPLRLKARLNLYKDKLSIVTTIGYTIGINNDFGSSSSSSIFLSRSGPGTISDSIRVSHMSNYNLAKTYGMVETGIGYEYKFKNALKLYTGVNHLAGFKRVIETDISYRIDDEPEQAAMVFSNGNYFSIVFGIQFPISNLW